MQQQNIVSFNTQSLKIYQSLLKYIDAKLMGNRDAIR